ncbi:MAG: hypothetical protein ACOC0X_07080 [Halobacteriota archaeon]
MTDGTTGADATGHHHGHLGPVFDRVCLVGAPTWSLGIEEPAAYATAPLALVTEAPAIRSDAGLKASRL